MSDRERDFKREMLAEIESNDMYRDAMKNASDADRAAVKRAVEAFVGRFAEDLIAPLMKSADSPELKRALLNKLRGVTEAQPAQAKAEKRDAADEDDS